MKKSQLIQLIQEEVETLVSEVDYANIGTILETFRQGLIDNGKLTETVRDMHNNTSRKYTSLPLEMVCRLVEVPVNHMMLYFMNNQRLVNENQLPVALVMQHIYFFEDVMGPEK